MISKLQLLQQPELLEYRPEMHELYQLLPQLGFAPKKDLFLSTSGLFITFEPGGQIEYGSPALAPQDCRNFSLLLEQIEETNQAIQKALGIVYQAVGYLPGREDAPLCLDKEYFPRQTIDYLADYHEHIEVSLNCGGSGTGGDI